MSTRAEQYLRPRRVAAQYSMIDDLLRDREPADPMLIEGGDGEAVVTFGQMTRDVARVAAGLAAMGIRPGDRVGVVAPQGRAAALAHLAILWAGAVTVPLSTRESPSSVEGKLERVGAAAVVVDPTASRIAPGCPVVSTDGGGAGTLAGLLFCDPGEPVRTAADDPALIVFTSGTTGSPRAAVLPHRILPARLPAFCSAQDLAPQPGDRFWTPVEWTWVGSLVDSLFTPWAVGMPVVVQSGVFEPQRAAQQIEDCAVRNVFLPPTALRMMRGAGVRLARPIRALHSGGEALDPDVIEWAAAAMGARPNEIYGQTEASFLIGSGGPNPARPGLIGRAYPGHRVVLLDDDEQEVPVGEAGEICVPIDDACVLLGYWGEPPPGGRWWHTGDLAVSDADGYIRFVSRKDDLILSSGYRVDPVQVERALMAHPAVALAAVVGRPDAVRGQVPVAFVRLREEGRHTTPDELRAWVHDRVPGYARPRTVELVSEVPLTATGKVARSRLRAAVAADEVAG